MIKFLATRLHLHTENIPETIYFNIETEGSRLVRNVTSAYKTDSPTQNTTIQKKKKIAATKIMETESTVTLGVSHGLVQSAPKFSFCIKMRK
jgi:hypothetical protein